VTQHLLLEVVLAGRTLRIADADLDIYDTDTGDWLHYTAGIDALTVERSFDFLSTASAAPSVPVECLFPVDLAAEDAAGHRLALSPASLSLWTEGDDYALRRRLVGGFVLDPEWGEEGEPVAFSIGPTAAAVGALVIPATHRIDSATLATSSAIDNLATEDLGVAYSRAYGSPGRIDATNWVTGGQGIWAMHQGDGAINYLRLVITGQHLYGSDYIWLSGDIDVPGHRFRVYNTLDGRGQPVCVVTEGIDWTPTNLIDAGSAVSGFSTDGDGYYYGLNCQIQANLADNNPNLPAALYQPVTILTPPATTPVSSAVFWSFRGPGASDGLTGLSPLAGDVILDMMQRAGIPVDFGRFGAAAALLQGYRFDCVIDDPEALALAWLQENVYPLLPISMSNGTDGDYPIVWRYDATADDATVRLDADADPRISRAGKCKDDASKVANAFSIQYRYSVRTDAYTATVTRDKATCPYCEASESRYGRIEKALTTRNVYDEATATAMLGWMARAYTSPSRRVPYLVPSEYRLFEGQIALLTDSRVSYSARICLVEKVDVDGTGIDGVQLLLVADLLRDLLSG